MNSLTYFKRIRTLPLLIALALIALVASAPTPAFATPSCGVTSVNLLDPVPKAFFPSGSLNLMCHDARIWNLITRIRGDSDLYVTEHTFDPGGQTGWHSHPGPSLITVIQGTLTVYHDDCTVETFTAGQSFTDLGCGDIHNAVNQGATAAIDVAVQLVPAGAPRRIDVANPGCAQPAPCP
ncbi:MAG TPA: cupin domain-containing protein [Bryobacteraceae bacterium]|jgi:quercetin dioxygenase-like cupin family protein|nr:cupin domain-containing protein [Bryobacteraceae bacterium]